MKKREQYKRLIMFLASVLIVAIQTGVFAYAWFHDYHTTEIIGRRYSFWGHWALITLYAFLVVVVSKLFSAFKVGYQRVLDVLLSQIFSVLIVNFVFYLQLALIGRWKFLEHVGPMVRVCAINLAAVIVWVLFMRWVYVRIYPPRQILLIYGRFSPKPLLEKMKTRKDKYIISGTISLDRGIDVIEEEILRHQAVMIGDIPAHERNLFLKFCFEHDIRCYCQPKISDIMIMSSEEINMFDTPLLLFRNRGLTVEQQAVKRLFDVVVSAMALVVLSPVFLIIAVLIKAYDGGPVFYRQERLTKDGKVFMVYKFRSMRVDSERQGARLAAKGDGRITPVGKVLRNIHFDELPQLLNIIKGDMSLVGPRPERPEIAREYEKEIPEFSYRLKVKAGLTGYAQVYGKYNTKPYDKLKLDLTYIENFSFLLDLQLIATTVKILFQKENTEGVEQWQTTASTGGPKLAEEDPAADEKNKKNEKNGKRVQNTERTETSEIAGWTEKMPEITGQTENTETPEITGQTEITKTLVIAEPVEQTAGLKAAENSGVKNRIENYARPLVSVIIPAYGCEKTIQQAVDSALVQEVPLEILVINDCSPDDLDVVMRQYRGVRQIRYCKNRNNLGVAATRNRGVKMAKGRYVAFLDADDWWEKDKLKKQLDLLEPGWQTLKYGGAEAGRDTENRDSRKPGHASRGKAILPGDEVSKQGTGAAARTETSKQGTGAAAGMDTSGGDTTALPEKMPVLCACGRELVTSEGKRTGRVIHVREHISYRRLLLHNCINCSSVVLRTDVARKFPMQHEDSHEDYITWMRILREYGYAVAVDEPLLKYRLDTSGKSGNKLKSAKMTYRAYRYAGFRPATAACLFGAYAVNGVLKYARAYLSGKSGDSR